MIAIITFEQKELMIGAKFAPDCFFNPIKDANNNWIISEEEINSCTNENYLWVKSLKISEYNPIILE